MDVKDIIAKWIYESRQDAGLSGEELGAKLALELGSERGFTKANVSHWENRRHSPSLEQVLAIARITGKKLPDEVVQSLPPQSPRLVDTPPPKRNVDPAELAEVVTRYIEASDTARRMALEGLRTATKAIQIPDIRAGNKS